jgi:hypothetical protein
MKWKIKGTCYLYEKECLAYLYQSYEVDKIKTKMFNEISFIFYGTNEEMRKFVSYLTNTFWFVPTKSRKCWF